MAIADFYRPNDPPLSPNLSSDTSHHLNSNGCFLSDWLCLSTPQNVGAGIFGFAEFIQALALLVLVYTFTDFRYKFRIEIAPLPVKSITFNATWIIGVGSLFSDFWYQSEYLVPEIIRNQSSVQIILGGLFLLTSLLWMWFAFVAPPRFGRFNYNRFIATLHQIVLRGSPDELREIAIELARSSDSLVRAAYESPRPSKKRKISPISGAANDVLLLIGDPKLCQCIALNAPGTAIVIFQDVIRHKKYRLPLSQLAVNVTTAAIDDPKSVLYVEGEGYYTGLLGFMDSFSETLYGNYEVVESLASVGNSPFDIRYNLTEEWTGEQWSAYGKIVLLSVENYVSGGHYGQHSYALYRAFDTLKRSSSDIYLLKSTDSLFYKSEPYKRFKTSVRFAKNVIEYLDKYKATLPTVLRRREERRSYDFDLYDMMADYIVDLIFSTTGIKDDSDLNWTIQHNSVWSEFFSHHSGKASRIIQFKVRRLMYDEIKQIETRPNYKSARLLGYCLNVMSVELRNRKISWKSQHALHQAVVSFARKQYLKLADELPDVAAAVIMGRISFDAKNKRLVASYLKGLNKETPRDILQLQ